MLGRGKENHSGADEGNLPDRWNGSIEVFSFIEADASGELVMCQNNDSQRQEQERQERVRQENERASKYQQDGGAAQLGQQNR